MTTSLNETEKRIQLSSAEWVDAPRFVRALIDECQNKRSRRKAGRKLMLAWPILHESAAHALLDERVPYTVDDEKAVVFTTTTKIEPEKETNNYAKNEKPQEKIEKIHGCNAGGVGDGQAAFQAVAPATSRPRPYSREAG